MDVLNDIGTCEREHVVVALHLEEPTRLDCLLHLEVPEIVLLEMVALDHRAHSSIEDEDALTYRLLQCLHRLRNAL